MGISIADVQKYIRDSVLQGIENGLQRDHSFLKYLTKQGPSNAKGPQYRVKTSGNGSVKSGFAIGGALNTPGSADSVQVQLPWGNYGGAISISNRGLLQIMQSEADMTAQIDDQLGWQIDDLVDEILDAMNTDAMTGTEGSTTESGIVGLAAQLTDTGTKGGINIGTYPGVGCYVNDNSGGGNRTLTKAILDTAFNEAVHENFKVKWDAPMFIGFAHHRS